MFDEVIKHLYVGDTPGYEKHKGREGFSYLRPLKEGPDGHRDLLGYTTLGAPDGPNYLQVRRGNLLALNLLDLDDPKMIPDAALDTGLKFIHERMKAGDKVLVACHSGHSRSQTLILMYLRAIGELPNSFIRSERIYRTISPHYDPSVGLRTHAKNRWANLPNFFR